MVEVVDVRALLTCTQDTGDFNARGLVRQPLKTSCTLHYNGPAIAGVRQWSRARLIAFIERADVVNHMTRLRADGLQYHFVVTPAGEVLQTRDRDRVLWHCRNAEGNAHSVAVHLPLGGNQDASDAQWAATTDLFDDLIAGYGMDGRVMVRGHKEWSGAATDCPGGPLLARLKAWRISYLRYRVRAGTRATIRQGPATTFPVAGELPAGTVFDVDKVLKGQVVGGDARWMHRADGWGFVHGSAVEAV